MPIQAVIFDMYETLVTQFCSPLYYGTQIAEDLGLRPEEFLPGWRATEEARATGKLTFEDAMAELLSRFPPAQRPDGIDWKTIKRRGYASPFPHLSPNTAAPQAETPLQSTRKRIK